VPTGISLADCVGQNGIASAVLSHVSQLELWTTEYAFHVDWGSKGYSALPPVVKQVLRKSAYVRTFAMSTSTPRFPLPQKGDGNVCPECRHKLAIEKIKLMTALVALAIHVVSFSKAALP